MHSRQSRHPHYDTSQDGADCRGALLALIAADVSRSDLFEIVSYLYKRPRLYIAASHMLIVDEEKAADVILNDIVNDLQLERGNDIDDQRGENNDDGDERESTSKQRPRRTPGRTVDSRDTVSPEVQFLVSCLGKGLSRDTCSEQTIQKAIDVLRRVYALEGNSRRGGYEPSLMVSVLPPILAT